MHWRLRRHTLCNEIVQQLTISYIKVIHPESKLPHFPFCLWSLPTWENEV